MEWCQTLRFPQPDRVTWVSSESGSLSSGNADSQGSHQFTKNDLPAGVHTISFEATDPIGLTASDTVTSSSEYPTHADTNDQFVARPCLYN